MATPRKRTQVKAAEPPADMELPLDIASLAAFMEIKQPDRERLGRALELAKEAALAVTGRPVGESANHNIRHGVHMLASQLLIKDQLEAAPTGAEIPGVVRYLWKTAA